MNARKLQNARLDCTLFELHHFIFIFILFKSVIIDTRGNNCQNVSYKYFLECIRGEKSHVRIMRNIIHKDDKKVK